MTRPKPEWTCFRCHAPKDAERFPWGRSGKRRSSVCWLCTEEDAYQRFERAMAYRATWTDPQTGRVVRRCFMCEEVKDLERDFYRCKRQQPTWKPPNMPCKPCSDRRTFEREHRAETQEKERARKRASAKRFIERHPEKVTERNKRHWANIKADPERLQRNRETQRINRALRKEREGQPLGAGRRVKVDMGKTARSYLPSAPLAALVTRLVDQSKAISEVLDDRERGDGHIGEVCARLGVDERTYRGWRVGEYPKVRIGMAEKVLMNAAVEWFEVYSYDDHAAQFLAEVTA